ncbi:MAG: phosphoribosylanthranilate isomerase [Beijerinckiaceae bacterium]
MNENDASDRLAHIVEASQRLTQLCAGSGGAPPNDEIFTLAVERLFMIVGEAAFKLSRLSKGQFPGVPWRDIVGLRHRLVHNYTGISPNRLFDIAKNDLPSLLGALEAPQAQGRHFPFPIKICGLSTPATMEAALDAGADMVALNFYPKSPRSVGIEQATALAAIARDKALLVALAVDPSDALLDAICSAVRPDLLQLHGTETPERLDEITARWELPTMKALGVGSADDLAQVTRYRPHIDRLLLDAKPPKDAAYPGGHGRTFDWATLKALDRFTPFMLSGGLTPDNVAEAIRAVCAMGVTLAGVDVSSGVESAPGVKDIGKMRAFVAAARAASQEQQDKLA